MKNLLFLLLSIVFIEVSHAQTTINGSFMHGGINRTYSFYVPASYTPGNAVPMVIGLHGLSSSGADFAQYRDFRPIADTANFIVVHPDGSTMLGLKFWNYENILGSTVDDVGFLEELIDVISASHSIDQERIYCAGMSNGSFMAYLMACESDRLAAIGTVTGSMSINMYDDCNPSHPTPSIHVHGTADGTNPYTGTSSMKDIPAVSLFWVNQNGCNTTPTITAVPNTNTTDGATAERYLYSGGTNGNTVEHFKVTDGEHSWPGSPMPSSSEVTCMDFDATKELWRFFSQHERTASLEENAEIQLNIWPNPTQNSIYLQVENLRITNVTIVNLQGRVVTTETGDNIQKMDVSRLNSGNYIAKINGDNFSVVRKIVVE